ncbi:MAG TPA: DinB family protein [Candidatus Kapabacteria bacterium]|nr:DinB family protein [Candidatus Kapabacteria bacterium]
MTTKSLLIAQFSATLDQENWFVPLEKAIAGLTAAEAAWRDGSANHSVWQITNHIYFWNERYYFRFKGTPLPSIEITNDETFENKSDADWQATINNLHTMMNRWRELLQSADESKFDEPFTEGKPDTWAEVISDINIHTAYHTGQILYVRKQQGKWNPA